MCMLVEYVWENYEKQEKKIRKHYTERMKTKRETITTTTLYTIYIYLTYRVAYCVTVLQK